MLRGSSRPYGSSGGFDIGNIIGEPVALATISIGFVSLLLPPPFPSPLRCAPAAPSPSRLRRLDRCRKYTRPRQCSDLANAINRLPG